MKDVDVVIREMTMEDFDEVHALWMTIHGFGIRSLDDSQEGIAHFIKRNPTTSMVAICGNTIIGAILCGHDGRRGCLYHVCVDEVYRNHGIGQQMVGRCLEALDKEHICKVNLIAFQKNEIGNRFWQGMGWSFREDVNYYEYVVNKENITIFNP